MTSTFAAADKLYEELLAQCEALMDARKGSKRADELMRLAALVEGYEDARWPIDPVSPLRCDVKPA